MKGLFLVLWLSMNFADVKITHLRNLLQSSYKSASAANEFHDLFASSSKLPPLLNGYKGMSELMLCNHVGNPFSKLSHFLKGKNLLENSLLEDPSNLELHFLRFIVQTKCPPLLQYNSNISNDRKLLLLYVKSTNELGIDSELKSIIKLFLLQSAFCSSEEKMKL